jgi:hypothetical protein
MKAGSCGHRETPLGTFPDVTVLYGGTGCVSSIRVIVKTIFMVRGVKYKSVESLVR